MCMFIFGLSYKSLDSQLNCSRMMIVKSIKYGNFAIKLLIFDVDFEIFSLIQLLPVKHFYVRRYIYLFGFYQPSENLL